MRNEANAIKFVAAKLAKQAGEVVCSVVVFEKSRSEKQRRSLHGALCVVLGRLLSQLVKPTY